MTAAAKIEQGTPEWHAQRCGNITASRISDVMAKGRGGGESLTRQKYIIELALERISGQQVDGFKSPSMKWGNECEQLAVLHYEASRGVFVEKSDMVRHPRIKNSGASPDRLVGLEGLLEIKCPDSHTHYDYLMGAKIPREYMLQMQWQMACTGRKWCDFMSYDPRFPEEKRSIITRVMRDDSLINEIEMAVVLIDAEVDRVVKELTGASNE